MKIQKPDNAQLLTRDRHYIRRTYQNIQTRLKRNQPVDKVIEKYDNVLRKSAERVEKNRENLPKVIARGDLPVSKRWDEVAETIRENQVSIICGATGSGKTTKIPQICFDLGLGACGKIAHTQPRRLAARTVSARIADELQVDLGTGVGYKVRFDEKYNRDTHLLLLTDGMLLAEINNDRFLSDYEVIIIDEAHERSLNIDFLLGYLKQILPKRPDLKIIITSATIDPETFSKHFNHAPIVMVEGKTFPVETLYLEPQVVNGEAVNDGKGDEEHRDLFADIYQGVRDLDHIHYGDTLIFLPTERDIRDAQAELEKLKLPNTEVLALFARQSSAKQSAIFKPKDKRRIILATNVAETSVTVPRILNVIDSGLARISRYSPNTKIQRLPIERISQASADQRKGRCGRIAPGVCLRLYTQTDFDDRPEFTDPEIRRTGLASVILQMALLGLGDIDQFPFVEPPDTRLINDGYRLLYELHATDKQRTITKLGRDMARLPIDPRFARMLLRAQERHLLNEVLPIVCALVVGDFKERPYNKEAQAGQKHKIFADEQSDFLFFVKAFNAIYPLFKQSKNKALRFANSHFFSALRVREWLYLVEQLADDLGHSLTLPDIEPDDKGHIPAYQGIHECLLTGLSDHIGLYDRESRDFVGARNKRFHIFPGSFLFKKKYEHIVCAEIVESSRVYARQVAKIDFAWLEPLVTHLTKTVESEPHWVKSKGNVMAKQTVLLHGVPLIANRSVPLGKTDMAAAHDIFVRHAIVENALNTRIKAIGENRKTYEKLLKLEEKSRTRDILLDETRIADKYFDIIPEHVYSVPTFEKWAKSLANESILTFSEQDFLQSDELDIARGDYPDHMTIRGQKLKLSYEFDPASDADGITAKMPLSMLNSFTASDFDYLIPVMLPEKIDAMIRALPKRWRRMFIPIPAVVEAVIANMDMDNRAPSLVDELIKQLEAVKGLKLTAADFDESKLDKHVRMNFALIDQHGKTVATDRDFAQLQAEYGEQAGKDFSRRTQSTFAEVFTDTFPTNIPNTHKLNNLTAYPALVCTNSAADAVKFAFKIELFDNEKDAINAHREGVLAFLHHRLHSSLKFIRKNYTKNASALRYQALNDTSINDNALNDKASKNGKNTATTLTDDLTDAVLRQTLGDALPRTRADYEKIETDVKKRLAETANRLSDDINVILERAQTIRDMLEKSKALIPERKAELRSQLDRLVFAGFIAQTKGGKLPNYPRYLKGLIVYLEKVRDNPTKDAHWQTQLAEFEAALNDKLTEHHAHALHRNLPEDVIEYAYSLEEYRLSVYAQSEVGAKIKVSAKKLRGMSFIDA